MHRLVGFQHPIVVILASAMEACPEEFHPSLQLLNSLSVCQLIAECPKSRTRMSATTGCLGEGFARPNGQTMADSSGSVTREGCEEEQERALSRLGLSG